MFETPRDAPSIRRDSAGQVLNAMTVDVEDYFHVSAFERVLDRRSWDDLPCRVEANMDRIGEVFAKSNISATFFILGWVAKRFPHIVRNLHDAGHEIASHGMQHTRATEQTPTEFQQDALASKDCLEQITGARVLGYRAASFSIGMDNLWALDTLADIGYAYSSSIYPVVHDLYGIPDAPRFPFRYEGRGVLEIPITTTRVLNQNIPCGGGGYFRLLPYRWSKWALSRVVKAEQRPGIFYFHPWEIDPGQPRVQGAGLKSRLRHYTNLNRMEGKLKRLLGDFAWDRMDRVFSIAETPENR